jgi:hypothetical protein
VLLANWSPPPALELSREYSMPTVILDATLGAAKNPGYLVRAASSYLTTILTTYVPGTWVATSPIPITVNLQQIGFAASYEISYSATVYLSQPGS